MPNITSTIKPVVLISLDGWGVAPPSKGNAIAEAGTPNFDNLVAHYPSMTLQASGEAVGLMWGEMGNSEVGHLNMGTGKIIYQTLPLIHKSITDGSFFKNDALHRVKKHMLHKASSLHLVGLLSDGGVHSHSEHLMALLDFCNENGLRDVYVHVILDGRDTAKDSGAECVQKLEKKFHEIGFGVIASISGRFYAMDRDRHYERVAQAYNAMIKGKSHKTSKDPLKAVEDSYAQGVYDEEFAPTCIVGANLKARVIKNKDVVIFFNFRADRARQLTQAFVLPGFDKFPRGKFLEDIFFATFTMYDKDLPVSAVVFPPEKIDTCLAKILAENNLRQLHIAETEKYAHVTYFFNGGNEEAVKGEERVLIPSPSVPRYDEKPEMSAYEITHKVLEELSRNYFHFIIVNFANADMVGHTGNLDATKKAVWVIDDCVGRIIKKVLTLDGYGIITADHGNAEKLIDEISGDINKEHTTNPVPCVIVGNDLAGRAAEYGMEVVGNDLSIIKPSGTLADIAPTVLKLLHLSTPESMTGRALI